MFFFEIIESKKINVSEKAFKKFKRRKKSL